MDLGAGRCQLSKWQRSFNVMGSTFKELKEQLK
jgi:hypothetical protein